MEVTEGEGSMVTSQAHRAGTSTPVESRKIGLDVVVTNGPGGRKVTNRGAQVQGSPEDLYISSGEETETLLEVFESCIVFSTVSKPKSKQVSARANQLKAAKKRDIRQSLKQLKRDCKVTTFESHAFLKVVLRANLTKPQGILGWLEANNLCSVPAPKVELTSDGDLRVTVANRSLKGVGLSK